MLNPWSLILIALAYTGLLFAIAWVGDKHRIARHHRNIQAVIYALSLGVYCTSWTFYGAVGSAATTGWGFLPIYVGPILLMLLGFDLLRRIALTSRDQRITSIADYIAYRFGRSHTIAVMVTLAAVIGSVPYIALQLKGVTNGLEVIAQSSGMETPISDDFSLYLALTLALFAIVFGTREMDAAEHHRGLMWAIAFESIVKLLAFIAIGLFVIFGVFDGLGAVAATVRENAEYRELFSPWRMPEGFGVQMVLAMAAILCLPRQFHVAMVEFRDIRELQIARWIFSFYLLVFIVLVVPIALAGLTQFSGQGVNPDTYMLALPLAADQPLLTVLTFLGGFSAATGMVIVATVALATMVSNDIVMPLLLRNSRGGFGQADLSRTLLNVRRISMLAITLIAYIYYRAIESGAPLASIGLLSFAAAAQFAPALVIGTYWRGASRMGAIAGLAIGFSAWLVLLLLPSLLDPGELPAFLPSMSFNDGAAISLLINMAALLLVSLLLPDHQPADRQEIPSGTQSGLITLGELQTTIGRFLGMDHSRQALATHLGSAQLEPEALATPAAVQFSERLLAGSIGSASARTVLSTALHHRGLGPRAVLELLDRTSQAVQFNRELLESTLDNLSQGVSVINSDLRIVGWNRRYLELMDYPDATVHLGQPIEELIRINAERGLLGDGDPENETRKRLQHFRSGEPYRYERPWLDERVIEIQGNPLPGGGYVTTYTDITHFKQIESKLQEINETLEQRVLQRTREVEEAHQVAVAANQSKTRFLAAASHDLLQPMNAARLFISILRQQKPDGSAEQQQLIKRVDRSLTAAEDLLGALLDISKLDSGMYDPEPVDIDVMDLLEQLRRRFGALAANRKLQLRVHCTPLHIHSDRNLLYRILQNFLANAIRYTEKGGVLIGCRLRGEELQISVWDTGVGIDESEAETIFQEFQRLEYAQRLDERGLGLGLAICERIGIMLGHRIEVRSRPGKGSCFSVTVPLSSGTDPCSEALQPRTASEHSRLDKLKVLCVDNEVDILDGMNLLLNHWGCEVSVAQGPEEASRLVIENGAPDLVLVDYHLSGKHNGLELMQQLDAALETRLRAIVITADRSSSLEEESRARGYSLLRKPIRPAALRALMTNTMNADAG